MFVTESPTGTTAPTTFANAPLPKNPPIAEPVHPAAASTLLGAKERDEITISGMIKALTIFV
jgi:hypothetical protein